jgi:hypothetical protein
MQSISERTVRNICEETLAEEIRDKNTYIVYFICFWYFCLMLKKPEDAIKMCPRSSLTMRRLYKTYVVR